MGLVSSRGKKDKQVIEDTGKKVLEVDASMQGDFHFKDPVNLKINGKFEGTLDTKGKLIINEGAIVNAQIRGEDIDVAGQVEGNIYASRSLTLRKSAGIRGDVKTPSISIEEGAVFNGKCQMQNNATEQTQQQAESLEDFMGLEELSRYIEVDQDSILQWIKEKRIPAKKIEQDWKFDRKEIDEWIAASK